MVSGRGGCGKRWGLAYEWVRGVGYGLDVKARDFWPDEGKVMSKRGRGMNDPSIGIEDSDIWQRGCLEWLVARNVVVVG